MNDWKTYKVWNPADSEASVNHPYLGKLLLLYAQLFPTLLGLLVWFVLYLHFQDHNDVGFFFKGIYTLDEFWMM